MRIIYLDCKSVGDWQSFHKLFADTLGFPDFYGSNMDAWIDCMTFLDEPEARMSTIHVQPGEVLTLVLNNANSLKVRLPDIYEALLECTAFVNSRRIEQGEPPVLCLAFYPTIPLKKSR